MAKHICTIDSLGAYVWLPNVAFQAFGRQTFRAEPHDSGEQRTLMIVR